MALRRTLRGSLPREVEIRACARAAMRYHPSPWESFMTLRAAKLAMVFAVATYYTLLVFNNITDYNSNYQFVRHVLMMDSTFPGNYGMWRALHQPAAHTSFYLSIIAWEFATMILCWWGGLRLAQALRGNAAAFHAAKQISIVGLTLALLMWLVAFLTVGGEWFLMWQSKAWNGQEVAVRMFTVIGIVLLLVVQPDTEEQP
jgi:predicted small integral membrane protein